LSCLFVLFRFFLRLLAALKEVRRYDLCVHESFPVPLASGFEEDRSLSIEAAFDGGFAAATPHPFFSLG